MPPWSGVFVEFKKGSIICFLIIVSVHTCISVFGLPPPMDIKRRITKNVARQDCCYTIETP